MAYEPTHPQNRRRQVAVVTGASAGVGRATALELARRGYDLGLVARHRKGLDEAAREVERLGARSLPLACDVSDAEALSKAADKVVALWGQIDVWVNCAMATVFSRFDDMTPEEYRRVTDVTYHGQVFGTQAALRHMRPYNRGTIVQVGSALGYRSIPLQSAYCGAKHAVMGFTESLRTELMHQASAIQLVMVHLPAVNTPQFAWARTHLPIEPRPAGRPVEPEVAARAIANAAAHPRREVFLGWQTVWAIVGDMVSPSYADVRAARTWEGQIEKGASKERRGNLFEPITDVRRDRGPFTETSAGHAIAISSRQTRLWLGAIALCGLAAVTGGAWLAGRRSSSWSTTGNRPG